MRGQRAAADSTCHPSPRTLLRSSPPLGRSGVLCSEDGFVFSLLLLESLSLMMSYCLQKRAITAAEREGMKASLTPPPPPTPAEQPGPGHPGVLVPHAPRVSPDPLAALHVWPAWSPWADKTQMWLKPPGHTLGAHGSGF